MSKLQRHITDDGLGLDKRFLLNESKIQKLERPGVTTSTFAVCAQSSNMLISTRHRHSDDISNPHTRTLLLGFMNVSCCIVRLFVILLLLLALKPGCNQKRKRLEIIMAAPFITINLCFVLLWSLKTPPGPRRQACGSWITAGWYYRVLSANDSFIQRTKDEMRREAPVTHRNENTV